MPTGWSYFLSPQTIGNNLSITNGKLQIGQFSTAGGIYRSFDTSGVTRVQIDYDAGIPNMLASGGVDSVLTSNILNYSLGPGRVQAGAGKSSGGLSMGSIIDYVSPAGVFQNAYGGVLGNQSNSSNFHFSTTYQDGLVSQTITNLVSGQSFSSGNVAISGFKLSDMSQLALYGVTSEGASASFDNVRISATKNVALPTPENFSGSLTSFVNTNLDLFPVDKRTEVAVSTAQLAPLLDSNSPKVLKILAASYADLAQRTADALYLEIAAIDTVTGGIKKGIEDLAEFLVLKSIAKIAEMTGDKKLAIATEAISLVSVVKGCVPDGPVTPIFATTCAAGATAFGLEYMLAPRLKEYSKDPLNPNYREVVTVQLPTVGLHSATFQPAFDAVLSASVYLAAVNETYDRYVAASLAGDQDAQLLQIQAYLHFLKLYNDAASSASKLLDGVAGTLQTDPIFGANLDVASILALIQRDVRSNGFAEDLVSELVGLGLSQDQISSLQTDLLQISPNGPFDSLAGSINAFSVELAGVSIASTVPVPGTLQLMLLGGVILLMRQRRTRIQN